MHRVSPTVPTCRDPGADGLKLHATTRDHDASCFADGPDHSRTRRTRPGPWSPASGSSPHRGRRRSRPPSNATFSPSAPVTRVRRLAASRSRLVQKQFRGRCIEPRPGLEPVLRSMHRTATWSRAVSRSMHRPGTRSRASAKVTTSCRGPVSSIFSVGASTKRPRRRDPESACTTAAAVTALRDRARPRKGKLYNAGPWRDSPVRPPRGATCSRS